VTKFSTSGDQIDLAVAQQQHEVYLERLRQYVPTLCLDALDDHADSVFVEDTVVAIGKRAVITNPGHPSRRGEVDTIKDVLLQLGMDVTDMRDFPDALCDGGDVLYTTRHLFVGLSERTNERAVELLSKTFENDVVETIAVPLSPGCNALHLKSIVTHLDATTLLAPTGDLGDDVLEAMRATERGYYDVIRLPNMLACNVVVVNGGVLAQDGGCHESRALLQEAAAKRNLQIDFLDLSETAKADGALTCCSVLLGI
jgi:dimethylargininase